MVIESIIQKEGFRAARPSTGKNRRPARKSAKLAGHLSAEVGCSYLKGRGGGVGIVHLNTGKGRPVEEPLAQLPGSVGALPFHRPSAVRLVARPIPGARPGVFDPATRPIHRELAQAPC